MDNDPKVRIRSAEIKDFEGVYPLLQQLWPDKELNKNDLMEVFYRGVESHEDEYFCAEINGEIVGFCSLAVKNSLWQESYIGDICEIVVDLPFRNQGIGTALLKTSIEAAKKKGCRRIELDSAFHRGEAHQFYEKCGFEKRAYLFSKEL